MKIPSRCKFFIFREAFNNAVSFIRSSICTKVLIDCSVFLRNILFSSSPLCMSLLSMCRILTLRRSSSFPNRTSSYPYSSILPLNKIDKNKSLLMAKLNVVKLLYGFILRVVAFLFLSAFFSYLKRRLNSLFSLCWQW